MLTRDNATLGGDLQLKSGKGLKPYILSSSESNMNEVPETVKLLPLGLVKSTEGNFYVDDESLSAMKAYIEKRGLDIVIDYEHQTLNDVQAPAAGWIKGIFKDTDSISAKVEWNPKAAEYLKNKEYRYLSPVVMVRERDQKAVILHSAALTNTPAITGMFAIVNSMNINSFEDEGGTQMEFQKNLAKILGLDENATPEEILKVIEALAKKVQADNPQTLVANKTIMDLLGLADDAKTEDAAAAIMALKAKPSQTNEIEELRKRLDQKEADELVIKALKSGKITPAQKEWAQAYALKDQKGFANFIEKAPSVVPMDPILENEDPKAKAKVTDEVTMAVCKQIGVSKEDIEKYGKEVK